MFVLDPSLQIVTISNFPSGAPIFECTGVTLADTGSGRWKCWQLKGPIIRKNGLLLLQFLVSTQMKRLQIMVSIDVSVKHCSFWNICNICRVLSARAVGRAWTGNSRTDSPSNRFYASLATRMFPLQWIKTVFFLHSDNRTTADSKKICTTAQFTDLVSNRFQPNVF